MIDISTDVFLLRHPSLPAAPYRLQVQSLLASHQESAGVVMSACGNSPGAAGAPIIPPDPEDNPAHLLAALLA